MLNATEIIPQEQVLNSLRLFAKEVMPGSPRHGRKPPWEEAAMPLFGNRIFRPRLRARRS